MGASPDGECETRARCRNGLGLCLDVMGANPANGTAVQSFECNGTPAQSWSVR